MEMKQLMVAAESVHVWSDDDEWVKSLVCVCVCESMCVWLCVCHVVQNTPAARLIPLITSNITSKSAIIRRYALHYAMLSYLPA